MARQLKIKKVSANDSLEYVATRILRSRLRDFYSQIKNDNKLPTPGELHDLRIAGKRLRYSAESLKDLFPDQLALLIDILKRSQDLLGDIQDCTVYSAMIEKDLYRLKIRNPTSSDITVLEKVIKDYRSRHDELSSRFHDLWKGLSHKGMRKGLKRMISNPKVKKTASEQITPD